MQSMAPFVRLSSDLRGFCLDLTRIANDIRLLASGPTTGFNEIGLPAVQPGSSTAIYTRTDGIVAWQTCPQVVDDHSENIEVTGGHIGLGSAGDEKLRHAGVHAVATYDGGLVQLMVAAPAPHEALSICSST